MAGAQLARSRAPETMDEFVARRNRKQAQRDAHYAAGQDRWSASTRTGQNLSAARPSDVVVLGAQHGFTGRSSAAPPSQARAQSAAGTRYGSLYAPSPDNLAELRRQQAEFTATRREVADQNSWMAVPALAPVVVPLLAWGAGLLAARVAASPSRNAPLSFAEREIGLVRKPPVSARPSPGSQALSTAEKGVIRQGGRERLARANGISAAEMEARIHHSRPLEYAHVFPKADPNSLANLWALRDAAHKIASAEWTAFRATLKGRMPTQAEVMAAKLRIDQLVAQYVRRPGVPRSRTPVDEGGPL